MSLIIHAPNIHQGGGRTLLIALLSAVREPAVVLLDKRLAPAPAFNPLLKVIQVAPSITSRLSAELKLLTICKTNDTLLCFGNLPPLFANRARVFVYLQNRYLSSQRPLKGLPLPTRLRIRVERLWLRFCLRDARLLVQTETMAQEVRDYFGVECHVAPFLPMTGGSLPIPIPLLAEGADQTAGLEQEEYDYLYVASGEAHKNHRRLVDSWIILAERKCFPSLCLTLDFERDADLWNWTKKQAQRHDLRISNRPLPPDQISQLYEKSRALIYPSLFESFGLPLLEARAAGLEIIASERDFVRDVVAPIDSFDPESALSIARAVLRHHSLAESPAVPEDATWLLQKLEGLQ